MKHSNLCAPQVICLASASSDFSGPCGHLRCMQSAVKISPKSWIVVAVPVEFGTKKVRNRAQTSPTAQYNVKDLNPVSIFLALPMRSVRPLNADPEPRLPPSSCVANCARRFFFFFEQKLRGVHCSGAPLLNGNGGRGMARGAAPPLPP